jgi:hypothetical protein
MIYDSRVSEFKSDLFSMHAQAVFEKHVLASRSATLEAATERDLLLAISREFQTSVASIFIVGSAQLGFRLLAKQGDTERELPMREQFSSFDNHSDIDVAIVNRDLFLFHWHGVNNFYRSSGYSHFSKWSSHDERRAYSYYLMQGWLRPDALPGSGDFDHRAKWTKRVDQINQTRITHFPVKIGVYYDERFLVAYQTNSIEKCKAAFTPSLQR